MSENECWQNVVILTITNKKIVDDLVKLKCVPRKSCIIELPTYDIVPENLFRHFLRGYFDGDGCMYYQMRKDRAYTYPICIAQFTSSIPFCKALSIYLSSIDIKNCLKKPDRYHPNNTSVTITGYKQLVKLIAYLYDGMKEGLFLKRKRDVYLRYLEARRERKATFVDLRKRRTSSEQLPDSGL